MNRSALVTAWLLVSACSVQLTGAEGHVCNAEHRCPSPLVCAAGVCSVATDGGETLRDDAGVRWVQVAHGFDGTSVGTGCSAAVDAADGNRLDPHVLVGPSKNFAWGDVTSGLPTAQNGRIGGQLAFPASLADVSGELRLLRVLNAAGEEVMGAYLVLPTTLELSAAAGTLSDDAVAVYPAVNSFPDLAPLFTTGTSRLELSWTNGRSLAIYVNGTRAFSASFAARDGGTGAVPAHLELGLAEFDGTAPDGGFPAVYSHWSMSGDPDAVLSP